MAAKCIG